jgi:hypothetical protein
MVKRIMKKEIDYNKLNKTIISDIFIQQNDRNDFYVFGRMGKQVHDLSNRKNIDSIVKDYKKLLKHVGKPYNMVFKFINEGGLK